MPPAPRKRTPASKRTPPVAKNDDINEWAESQPVITVAVEPEDDIFPEAPGVEADPRPQERAPNIPSPIATKARDFVANIRERKPSKTAAKKAPKPRISVEKLIGGAWQMLAQLTAPINLPVARVIDMQAPVAGMILEDSVRGTVVDRVLQPLAGMMEGGETVFALLGPPLIVGAITAKPESAMVLRPVLRQALMSWVNIAGPHLEAVEKREQVFQEKYGARVDQMIDYFFGDLPTEYGAHATPNGAHPEQSANAVL